MFPDTCPRGPRGRQHSPLAPRVGSQATRATVLMILGSLVPLHPPASGDPQWELGWLHVPLTLTGFGLACKRCLEPRLAAAFLAWGGTRGKAGLGAAEVAVELLCPGHAARGCVAPWPPTPPAAGPPGGPRLFVSKLGAFPIAAGVGSGPAEGLGAPATAEPRFTGGGGLREGEVGSPAAQAPRGKYPARWWAAAPRSGETEADAGPSIPGRASTRAWAAGAPRRAANRAEQWGMLS